MTLSRCNVPGRTYMMTRRCTQRQFLLTPSRFVRNAYLYCLGFAANRWGMDVHCYCALGNHHHPQVTDPLGFMSKFAEDMHKYLAKVMNAHWGRWENLFDNAKPSYLHLVDADAVRRNTTYILTNPVEAGLVHRAKLWPGAWSRPIDMAGGVIRASKPSIFFSDDGPMPDEIEFRMTPPPAFADMSSSDYIEMVATDLKKEERKIRKRFTAEGRSFMGVKAIRAQNPFDSPKSQEPRRQMNPRVKTRDKWRRIEALQRNRVFHQEYREAYKRFRAGDKDVLFPYGTWWYRIYAGAQCRPPPAT